MNKRQRKKDAKKKTGWTVFYSKPWNVFEFSTLTAEGLIIEVFKKSKRLKKSLCVFKEVIPLKNLRC